MPHQIEPGAAINALRLFIAALPPTLVAIVCFYEDPFVKALSITAWMGAFMVPFYEDPFVKALSITAWMGAFMVP